MALRRAASHTLIGFGVAVGLAASSFSKASFATAEGPFAILNGAWTGSGQIRLTSGSAEALKCKAYYTPKEGSSALGLAIRCASASSKIELRANLMSQGGRVSGTWEERTFNASGAVTGQATGNRLTLTIAGGGFTGTMAVSTNGGSQTVNITTDGIALQGVNISLSKG